MGVLIVVAGPPLPGRGALARALADRVGARGLRAGDDAEELAKGLAGDAPLVVEGELKTAAERRALWSKANGRARRWVAWGCGRPEAEREIFRRYASRPQAVAAAELQRYEDDARGREPIGAEVCGSELVEVTAELPLDAQVKAALAGLPATSLHAPTASARRRVMVVEDDSDQREMLAEVLSELGCDVEPAANGAAAMARLDAGANVDVLISDQRMPGMSGIELTRALARSHPRVRAILLTAFGDEQTCREALQARAVTVLAKPVRVVDLQRVLDEAYA